MYILGYQMRNGHNASNGNVRFAIAIFPPSLHGAPVMYGYQCNMVFILAHMRHIHQDPTKEEKLNQNILEFANVHLIE